MAKQFTEKQINELRTQYATVERIDPCLPTYKKLCALLDRLSDTQLMTIAEARIKFVSLLARNRCITRGLIEMTNANA